MADRRINYAKQHEDLITKLKDGAEGKGPFKTNAEVIAFAASYAASKGKDSISKLPENKQRAEPIRRDIFSSRGFETVINLLALYHTSDASILKGDDESEDRRTTIFEEYAHCGLNFLANELADSNDYTRTLMVHLSKTKSSGPESSSTNLEELSKNLF